MWLRGDRLHCSSSILRPFHPVYTYLALSFYHVHTTLYISHVWYVMNSNRATSVVRFNTIDILLREYLPVSIHFCALSHFQSIR